MLKLREKRQTVFDICSLTKIGEAAVKVFHDSKFSPAPVGQWLDKKVPEQWSIQASANGKLGFVLSLHPDVDLDIAASAVVRYTTILQLAAQGEIPDMRLFRSSQWDIYEWEMTGALCEATKAQECFAQELMRAASSWRNQRNRNYIRRAEFLKSLPPYNDGVQTITEGIHNNFGEDVATSVGTSKAIGKEFGDYDRGILIETIRMAHEELLPQNKRLFTSLRAVFGELHRCSGKYRD